MAMSPLDMSMNAAPGAQPGAAVQGGGAHAQLRELALPRTGLDTWTVRLLPDESYHNARDRVIAQFETQYLRQLLARADGNMSRAARIAGVDRTTLYRLMERQGLRRHPRSEQGIEPLPAARPASPPASVRIELP